MTLDLEVTPAVAGRSDILAALRSASAKTGADFDYLLSTAMRESNLDAQAKSKASSATGLFQFVEQTWLSLVKRFGDRHGLSEYAAAIRETDSGRFTVASHDTKSAILALRKDPELSAVMAGEAAKETKQSLECALGRKLCEGELYAAHFLGTGGARHLIELKDKNPDCAADVAFPQAAKANRSVFYHADGSAKSVRDVYALIVEQREIPDSGASSEPSRMLAHATIRGATQMPADGSLIGNSWQSDETHLRLMDDARIPMRTLGTPFGRTGSPEDVVKQTATLPQSPLVLSPGVVEILASLSAFGADRSKRGG